MSRTKPYITFELQPTVGHDSSTMYPEEDSPKKRWYQYLPLCLTVGLLLMPHPSLLIMLVKYHLNTLQSPFLFITHLLVAYSLSFLALSSLMLCVVRDPGPVTLEKTPDDAGESEEVGITQALMGAEDFNSPGKWCRKCWAPKPERTHHCSQCGRCVLKMDHHCPWIASKCIGHRTYPAFVHFLGSVTLLALYIAVISISALVYSFNNAIRIDDMTPVHELLLACAGLIFSLVIGSFFSYHVYLVTTNQTTLENINQFIVLRYLPPLPPLSNGRVLSDPPMEHELSYPQRRIVRHAHGKIRMYDVGWRRNWAQVFGWNRSWGWVYRILVGGGGAGDGRMFPHNPRSDDMLAKLANELIEVDKQK